MSASSHEPRAVGERATKRAFTKTHKSTRDPSFHVSVFQKTRANKSVRLDFCLSLTAPVVSSQGVGGPSLLQVFQPGPHSVCSPCSHAHLGLVTTACASSAGTWTISVGSYMQQGVVISLAPCNLRTLLPVVRSVQRRIWDSKKVAITHPRRPRSALERVF